MTIPDSPPNASSNSQPAAKPVPRPHKPLRPVFDEFIGLFGRLVEADSKKDVLSQILLRLEKDLPKTCGPTTSRQFSSFLQSIHRWIASASG